MFINFYLFLCVFFFFCHNKKCVPLSRNFSIFCVSIGLHEPFSRCEVRVKKKKEKPNKTKRGEKKNKKKEERKNKRKKNTEEEKTEKSPRYFIGRLIHTRSQSQCIAFIPGKLLVVQSIDRLFARIQGPFC